MDLSIRTLVSYCDALLDVESFEDLGPNGLQVEGNRVIRHLVSGVSACAALFEQAAQLDADAVLVHHGLFWKGQPQTLVGHRALRVRLLMQSGIHLLAYHLPLDRHPEFGNNALGAKALGLYSLSPFGVLQGCPPIGYCGSYPEPISPIELRERARAAFGQEPIAFLEGPKEVTRVGVLSGGGAKALEEAIQLGLDALVTGEPAEWSLALAREAKIHFLACGHHATERCGVKALGEHLAIRFQINHTFVDLPNPV